MDDVVDVVAVDAAICCSCDAVEAQLWREWGNELWSAEAVVLGREVRRGSLISLLFSGNRSIQTV